MLGSLVLGAWFFLVGPFCRKGFFSPLTLRLAAVWENPARQAGPTGIAEKRTTFLVLGSWCWVKTHHVLGAAVLDSVISVSSVVNNAIFPVTAIRFSDHHHDGA